MRAPFDSKGELQLTAQEIREVLSRGDEIEVAMHRQMVIAMLARLFRAEELLREVYEQAGNGAPPARRHALTPKVRDDMRKFLYS